MNPLYLARRLRVLTESVRVCPAFAAPAHNVHGYCLRCGGEELAHVARLAADVLDPSPLLAAAGAADESARDRDGSAFDVDTIDIINKQIVSLHGGQIVILRPCSPMQPLDALVHAAWIVALAEIMAPLTFDAICERVKGA